MSKLHETVAHKNITQCVKFREYTKCMIDKNFCYNNMQKYSNQLEEALKEFKYHLQDILSKKKRGVALDIVFINKKNDLCQSKIEQLLEKYESKIAGFKKAKAEHRDSFTEMFNEITSDHRSGDLLEDDLQYCTHIIDEAFADLGVAKNKYEQTNSKIMQLDYEIKKTIKEVYENIDGISIKYKSCQIPLFLKKLAQCSLI